jgi:cell division protein FtsL
LKVQSQNYLGIYISKDTATVACVNAQGGVEKIVGGFSVSAREQEQPNMQTLANQIAQGCAERKLTFSDAAIALDCAMFMQHTVKSEFIDPKQIAATIRFDTEEALATDIADIALAFQITSIDDTGSTLTVFTAQKKLLSEVILALQQHNIDPITMEPDIYCLSRFIARQTQSDQHRQGTLYAMLSGRSGYLIAPPSSGGPRKSSLVRTFLVGPKQNRTELLIREVLMTSALSQSDGPIKNLRISDSTTDLDKESLTQKTGIETAALDLFRPPQGEIQNIGECSDHIECAIACGAATSLLEKEHKVNFRDDFSPFQGRKVKIQKALKFAAFSVSVLFIAVGLYFQIQLFTVNRELKNLRNKFSQDYAAVALEKLPEDATFKKAVRDLGTLQRKIEAQTKGLGDADRASILSKLTLILTAFNKCADKTDLNLKRLAITSQNITITGDTSGRSQTTLFFNTLRANGLNVNTPSYELKGNRDGFSITVTPKNI